MKNTNLNHEVAFGISFSEHQKRAQHIYNTVVKPQLDADERLKEQGLFVSNPTLSSLQKSHANCKSLI